MLQLQVVGGRVAGGREEGKVEFGNWYLNLCYSSSFYKWTGKSFVRSFSRFPHFRTKSPPSLSFSWDLYATRRGEGGERGKGGKRNTSLLYIQGDLCTTQNGKEKIQFLLLLLASSSSTPHFCSCPPPQAPSPLGLGVSTSFFLLHKRKYLITTYGVTSEQQYSLLLSSSASSSNQHFDCYSPLRLFLRLGFWAARKEGKGGRGKRKGESSFFLLWNPRFCT